MKYQVKRFSKEKLFNLGKTRRILLKKPKKSLNDYISVSQLDNALIRLVSNDKKKDDKNFSNVNRGYKYPKKLSGGRIDKNGNAYLDNKGKDHVENIIDFLVTKRREVTSDTIQDELYRRKFIDPEIHSVAIEYGLNYYKKNY